ncbi:MAG: hypothetical protein KDI90_07215 [Alphaproteobacteria bacterium]|nr:hypothetical protein [Alphaproteobacteria bacterium]MCB9974215.1 hypothetical protein [Rhodospirillales bacterium]
MRFRNIPGFEDFDPETLKKSGHRNFIILGNFFFQDDPYVFGSRRRRNYKSGITEAAFHALVREFCTRRNLQIMLADEEVAIIAGSSGDFRQFQLENGSRFSYDYVDAKKAADYVSYTITVGGIPHSQFREVQLDA